MQTETNVPMPKRRKARPRVPQALRDAAQDYKDAYKAAYGVKPELTWDGKWIRIKGQAQGVSLRRLKELTTQLRARADL